MAIKVRFRVTANRQRSDGTWMTHLKVIAHSEDPDSDALTSGEMFHVVTATEWLVRGQTCEASMDGVFFACPATDGDAT